MTSSRNPAADADAADRALDAALRDLHRDVLAEPVPSELMDSALRLSRLQQRTTSLRHWGGMAAGVVLAFSVGWLAHGQLGAGSGSAFGLAKATVEHEFVRQAGFAYSVYMPEKRHPVEVSAPEQEHLVQWLSKRVGKPLKIPKLEALGFELVGGRLLPGEGGARAQFMFQNSQSQRITLYLGAVKPTAANQNSKDSQDTQATQFRFEPNGPVPSFYWADEGFGYALSGQVDKATLMALADAVYQQIH
jgi:anti-sigma factor RsiW